MKWTCDDIAHGKAGTCRICHQVVRLYTGTAHAYIHKRDNIHGDRVRCPGSNTMIQEGSDHGGEKK